MNADYDDSSSTRQRLFEQTKADVVSKQIANSTAYDTSILTLSSAFLALSVVFIKDVVAPISTASHLLLLYLSWSCFCLAIIVTIASFMLGQWGYKALLEGAERYYLKNDGDAFRVSVTVSRRIGIANYIHGGLFVLGTILMLIFVIDNFSRLANMPDANVLKPSTQQRGQPTNTFQQLPAKPASAPSAPQPASPSSGPR